MSTLTRNQKRFYGPRFFTKNGRKYRITAMVRHDDECGNGHNSFAITGQVDRYRGNNLWVCVYSGCIHDEVAKHFPEIAPFIKWHLCATDGPLYYIANTTYYAGDRDHWDKANDKARELDMARIAAVWPDATDEELTAPGLEQRLRDRLPALLVDFRRDVESLGFIF